MSHNQSFKMGEPLGSGKRLGTAYEGAASGSAEGDIGGLREDDANLHLEGLREDDSNLRLNGLREDDADLRLSGLREDDSDLRLGSAESAEAEIGIEMEGLREDDSDLRLGDTTFHDGATGNAEGSSEGHRDAQMGRQPASMTVHGRMGTSYAPDAEGSAEADNNLDGLREDDADLKLSGLREDDSDLRLNGLREDDANLSLNGLREDDADLRLSGTVGLGDIDDDTVAEMTDEELSEALGRRRKYGVEHFRNAVSVRNRLRRSGRGRGHVKVRGKSAGKGKGAGYKGKMSGAEEFGPVMGADGFHERFPVTVEIKGLGRIDTHLKGYEMGGLFDFLIPNMGAEEYMGKLKVIKNMWGSLRPRLQALPSQTRTAISTQMDAADSSVTSLDINLPIYISDGYPGALLHTGRFKRILVWEAYLPTLSTVIAQAEALGPAPTPSAEKAQVNATAVQSVVDRQAAASKPNLLTDTLLPIAAVAGGTAIVTGIALSMMKG